jgi:two-component system response regulator WspF
MRIGIVNDVPLAREALRRVVASAPGHRVAWLAADGAEAVAAACRDPADLILMDLLMPVVDGVEATRRIMAEAPCPILVVTATVSGNVGKVYEAMGHGALDAVDTPMLGPGGDLRGAGPLLAKIDTVGKLTGKSSPRLVAVAPAPPAPARPEAGPPLVALGASTGGPNALVEVLAAFPRKWGAAIVLIQHVDVAFAPGLARWLRERSGHHVEVTAAGARPEPGRIDLAATNDHLRLDAAGCYAYNPDPVDLSYRPSLDVFFESAAASWRPGGAAVVLTGMGRDGAAGLLRLRRAGWLTVAQDEASSVVWGMPRAAAELGAAAAVLPLAAIGPFVVDHVQNRLRHVEGSS